MADRNIAVSSATLEMLTRVRGEISDSKGDVILIRASGEEVSAIKGTKIYLNDTLLSRDDSSVIAYFGDSGVLVLGQNQQAPLSYDFFERIDSLEQIASSSSASQDSINGPDGSIDIKALEQALQAGQNIEELLDPAAAGGITPEDGASSTIILYQRTGDSLIPVSDFGIATFEQVQIDRVNDVGDLDSNNLLNANENNALNFAVPNSPDGITLSSGLGVDILNSDNGDDILNNENNALNFAVPNSPDGITLSGGLGADILNGDDGDDILNGGRNADILNGDDGDDILNGDRGSDTLNGGDGADTLNGGLGSDTLNGDDGSDILNGGIGADILNGDDGDDILNGGRAADVIFGGAGSDTLTGGTGADTFVWQQNEGGGSTDRITDFSIAEGDALNLSDFLTLGSGVDLTDFLSVGLVGADTVIAIDANGDGSGADLTIVLEGVDLGGLGIDQAAILDSLIFSNNLIVE